MNSKRIAPLASLADLGDVIRAARRKKKLSQSALGQQAGLSRMPVYRLEAGRDVSLASFLSMLPPLDLALSMNERTPGPLRASDLAQAFAHLQEEQEEQEGHEDDDGPSP